MTYLIVQKNPGSLQNPVTSRNSRELKRRIKSSKPQHKKYVDGMYNFVNKDGVVCFSIEYKTQVDVGKKGTRIIGKEVKK